MTRTTFEEMKTAVDLEYWLDREGQAFRSTRGRSGEQLNVRECPACGRTDYRVYLNRETGVGNCFGCNEPYNKLTFIRKVMGDPSWGDLAKHLGDVLVEQGWRPKRQIETAVEYEAAKLPRSIPMPTKDGQNLLYLEERGIGADLARYFHLSYSAAGVWVYADEEGNKRTQDFGKRLIIPVFDFDGKLATFQGRDVTGEKEPRYLFPKGLPGTGRYLLNGQNASNARRVAMGEGFFDVASLKKAFDGESDLRDVVAIGSFGKHLSYGALDGDDQLGRLMTLKKGGLRELTIMWDGGAKELTAALDAAKHVHGAGIVARIALLPKGRDPNEILPEQSAQAFREAMPYSTRLDMQWRLKNPYAGATF